MMKKNTLLPVILGLAFWAYACKPSAPQSSTTATSLNPGKKSLAELALEESKIPVRPGIPGQVPFWNKAAKRFIYAPAFDYQTIPQAVKYRYRVVSEKNGKTYRFEEKVPYAPLSPVWDQVPVGNFEISVTGLSASGDSLGLAGKGKYYRASPFNGPYHQPPVKPYDQSAMLALDHLLQEDYVNYWRIHKKPDPNYTNYKYPAKIYSALVIGAVTHARLKPNTPEARQSTELARTVADFMLQIRYKPGSAWEHFVPTYYAESKFPKDKPHMDPVNNFTIMGVDAGTAFLDLYDLTRDDRYLDAAKLIAQTYLKNQQANGSWYQFTHYATDKPVEPVLAIPTAVINYFDRLRKDYQVKNLEQATAKALQYIMNGPVKTFDWQGQFEDIAIKPPYKNLSREQACDLAIYLFNNSQNNPRHLALAKELVRFAEDQFVIWEQPMPKRPEAKGPRFETETWITPSVQEQYVFWTPVGRAAGIMVETFWQAYAATKAPLYLAKAKSLAGSFTAVQQAHDGEYPTFFSTGKTPRWLNSTVYPAKVLMNLAHNTGKGK
ncbi:MAG: hypothetical protein ACO1O1_06980 [Adhaeribacter sp.]